MELKQEQIDKFIELHKDFEDFKKYSDAEIREIANGVANYYLTLYRFISVLKKIKTNHDISFLKYLFAGFRPYNFVFKASAGKTAKTKAFAPHRINHKGNVYKTQTYSHNIKTEYR